MGRKMTVCLDKGAEIAHTCGLKTEGVMMSNWESRLLDLVSLLISTFLWLWQSVSPSAKWKGLAGCHFFLDQTSHPASNQRTMRNNW